ncbi:GH92 family glycosyl hydrolase [Microbacterium sp. CIAB417]|uniref:GH92 family glycosyl hydrolase n=1 Tax=Microbacterium sp. CIAB417 TaxID=2860287 RepID=UPI001FADA936|nr:GH92 family glycosyl hydrolase [Microbacterium sp. CIAB417]
MSSHASDHPTPPRRRHRAVVAAGVVTVLAASAALTAPAAQAAEESALSAFDAVDPFIGTEMNDANNGRGNDHYGNTFPGATVPFGMVQSSPTTYQTSTGEQYGGYEYQSDQLRGFGMTRLSGTGCRSNYGGFDFPVLPFAGELTNGALPSNPASAIGDYFLDYSHDGEVADPGYYSVDLAGVQAELTSTTRTAVSRYSFDDNATLLFEAGGSNNQVHASDIAFDPATGELSGSVTANIVCNGGGQYTAHFSATFDQPVESYGVWTPDGVQAQGTQAQAAAKHGAGAWLTFADGADVTAKIGLSYVSVDGARANATAEAADLDFDTARAQARAVWEQALGTIDATGGSDRDRITFYTSLYHALLHPNTFQDVDGTYIGYDGEAHTVEDGRDFYVNFSGWDTYRGQSQLVALLYPERASDINQSIVDMVTQSGKWTSWPSYNRIQTKMSGDSLQNIVAATDDFGSTDYDRATALATMIATQTLPMTDTGRSDAVQYGSLGWIDGDKQGAATSRTLEYATNDFAIAQLAQRLGDQDAYELFSTRSQNWKNVFNYAREHVDARNRNGFMNTSLTTQGAQFEQSTGLQYGFNVSHNMADLIEARGGIDQATTDLDSVLRDLDGGAFSDTAYIANQPSFGLPWVYNWLQAPHKTTETLYRAADELFTTAPDGLAGNDDLGSFSAWYVWANLGLMPAIWGTADLLVSAPMFEHIEITSIGSDRVITIDAPGAGDDRRYTTGLAVDGTAQTASWLPADFAREGGTLAFTMAESPGSWGTGADDVPPSYDAGVNARGAVGITDDGAVNMGGLDAGGVTLSRQDLEKAGITGGSQIPLGETGVVFTWPDTQAGEADHWIPSGQVLEFGDVAASGISFLGTATNGPSRGTAIVTYSDGTTQDVDVRLSDWVPGSMEPGNVRVIELTKRNTLNGGSDSARPVVFGTSVVPLDPEKTVRSVALPTAVSKGIMHVFDVALRPVEAVDPGEPELPTRPEPQQPTEPTTPEPTELDGTAVVDAGTEWRFHDTEDDPADGLDAKTGWTAADYDDSSWKTGVASFGAKNGAIADLGGGFTPTTLVTQHKSSGENIEAFFFRTSFDLTADELAQVTQLNGELAYDDAARVYVNGELVGGFADARIDEDATSNMVYAGGNGTAPLTGSFTVPASVLQEGENTIAIQVHNTNATSSDVFLQLRSLTIAAKDAPAAISDVLLHVGSDETRRNLTFYTDREIAAQVQIAPASAREGAEFPVADARVIDAATAQARDGRFSNQVVIDDLAEETAYLYRVGNDETGWSRSYELWTGTFDETYSFVYLTDAQIGASGSWQNDRDRWAAAVDQIDQFEKDASMIVSGGDQVETHRSEDEYASLIAPELLKQLPFQATIGNHDNQSDQFNSHFFTPNRSETHGYESTEGRAGGDYWYTYNDVLYLNINTNARSTDEEDHAAFLREVVEEHGADANWIVAVMHHSLYSAAFHSVEQDVIERRAALAPVFSELGVDLVLAGHDHIYTRSYLMDGTTPVGDLDAQEQSGVTLAAEEGQVLYVTGNSASGSKFYGLDASSPEAAIKDQSNQPQYTDVDVSPSAITLTTYQTMDRTVIDQVTLTRTVDDAKGPEFSGLDAEAEVTQGQPFDPLEGVTAVDEIDGDVSAAIQVEGTVDVRTPGSYPLVYRVADKAGNETVFERVVTVTAVEPTFGGVPPTREVVAGTEFDELEGVTAVDANGVDITDRIQVERITPDVFARMFVPEDSEGFTLRYTVTDDYGTTATAETVVTVVPTAEPTDPGQGGGSGGVGGPGSGGEAGDGTLPATGGQVPAFLWALGVLALFAGAALVARRRMTRV